jgi:hypothetical protein
VPPGDYRVVLTVDGTEHVQTLTVEADPTAPRSGIAGDEGEGGGEPETPTVRQDD